MGNNSGLIIIDMQKGLFNRSRPVYKETDLIKNVNALIKKARSSNVKIIFSRHENNTFLKNEGDGWQIIDELDYRNNDIFICKKYGSVFRETNLEEILNKNNIGKLYVCGLVTQGCIKDTCIDAVKNGYKTILCKDCHSNLNRDSEKIIQDWNSKLETIGVQIESFKDIKFKINFF